MSSSMDLNIFIPGGPLSFLPLSRVTQDNIPGNDRDSAWWDLARGAAGWKLLQILPTIC